MIVYSISMELNNTSNLPHFNLKEPSQEVLNWANKHLGENPDTKYQVVSEFRYLIHSEGECFPHKGDDDFLLRFLRARRFNLDQAYELIVNYYQFKNTNQQYCKNIDIASLAKVIDKNILLVPLCRTADGRRISIFNLEAWNPDEITINEIMQTIVLVLHELGALEPQTQILGAVCILDLKGLSKRHLRYATPTFAQKLIEILVTACPVRIAAFHIINQSYAFNILYRIFTLFLTKSMIKRIFFHGDNLDGLHKYVNPEILPTEYGGKQQHLSSSALWINTLQKEMQVINELKALGYKYSRLEELYT